MNYVTFNELLFMFFGGLMVYHFICYCKGGGLKSCPRTIGKVIGLILKPFKSKHG